ncbi:hypothetical protein IGS75_00845 [Gluconobacter sphaericus]|uniref:hypothetical protein n=1 Tax=Gluconobacter sphaericus TaxID=574987 RepID=UPI001922859E|nr:hypothetical protein [Gluconobacter sphaericus]QQX91227.1 hypothetical protein IGS75_00845 [Gluconobacter sphaericus]
MMGIARKPTFLGEADGVEDRILRRAIKLRVGHLYIAALEAHRRRRFAAQCTKAANSRPTE